MNPFFERNIPAISSIEQEKLYDKKVLIVGCGGLGEYLAIMLARLGVRHITAVDFDLFDTNNLNRQLYSTVSLLGLPKIEITARQIRNIFPDITFTPVNEAFDKSNARELVHGQDLVLDALDNLSSRLLLADTCEAEQVPLVHGAITGWSLEVATCLPGKHTLQKLYTEIEQTPVTDVALKTSLSFTPPAAASIQIAEALKLLIGQEPSLVDKVFFMNLQTMTSMIIDL